MNSLAPTPKSLVQTFAGAFVGILGLGVLTQFTQISLLFAPFGASSVLLFALPQSPLAQPRAVIGGHLISGLMGFLVLFSVGSSGLGFALAVSLAIVCMMLTRTLHPPAGATPIVILQTAPQLDFLFTPLLLGSVLLVMVSVGFHGLLVQWRKMGTSRA